MSLNSALLMYVVNNTGAPARFSFSHQYAVPEVHDYPTVIWRSADLIPPNGLAGPLPVGFSVGLGNPGLDFWYCEATIDGDGTYRTEGSLENPTKECECRISDDGMVYYFPFDCSKFVIPLISGYCETGVSK